MLKIWVDKYNRNRFSYKRKLGKVSLEFFRKRKI